MTTTNKVEIHQYIELEELIKLTKLLHEQNIRIFISWLKHSRFFEV